MADFQWPELTDDALMKIWEVNDLRAALEDAYGHGYCGFPLALESLRAAIALDRQLLAAHIEEIRNEWYKVAGGMEWLLTRGGTVRPMPPTLAEARVAARLLAGPAAEVVTRYLESQEGQADG
jgi:hypothetical protein